MEQALQEKTASFSKFTIYEFEQCITLEVRLQNARAGLYLLEQRLVIGIT